MKPLAKTITHAFAAFGLAGTAIAPAMAGTPQTMTIRVPTGDIDLGTAKGQKVLDQRVEKAARQVCRTTSVTTGTRIMSQDAAACLAKARSDARLQVAALTTEQQRGG
ncbi:MAG: UrcA family protein [Sphingopyxis sp.]|nr:UrcA family protein [Sphingopyxis sp.]